MVQCRLVEMACGAESWYSDLVFCLDSGSKQGVSDFEGLACLLVHYCIAHLSSLHVHLFTHTVVLMCGANIRWNISFKGMHTYKAVLQSHTT